MTTPHTVAVVQARMGSTRLPGKVLEGIEGRPLLAWTLLGVQAIPGLADVVVATTTDAADDAVVAVAQGIGVAVHRGSATDVLSRCHDAVAPFHADIVVRQTADNPFPDPAVAAAQIGRLVDGGFDYVGIDGWPLGIAAEACRMAALATAAAEATDAADREHVMPFLYRHHERFRIGRLEREAVSAADGRFTVDTAADLAFARALAHRLGHGPPVSFGELQAIVHAEPDLLDLNAAVAQRSWSAGSQ
jgi:spore coat polysaccharide biosynthesis protein SpsF (cytidylyltransferase family)